MKYIYTCRDLFALLVFYRIKETFLLPVFESDLWRQESRMLKCVEMEGFGLKS